MVNCSVVSDSFQPHELYLQGSSCPWDSPGKKSRLPCPPPGDLPIPGIKPRYLALQEDSLPSEPPGKPIYLPKSYSEIDRQTDRLLDGWMDR